MSPLYVLLPRTYKLEPIHTNYMVLQKCMHFLTDYEVHTSSAKHFSSLTLKSKNGKIIKFATAYLGEGVKRFQKLFLTANFYRIRTNKP